MTYTKEQLEAWSRCNKMQSCFDCEARDVCRGRSMATTISPLAADLLSANEEIERLRWAMSGAINQLENIVPLKDPQEDEDPEKVCVAVIVRAKSAWTLLKKTLKG